MKSNTPLEPIAQQTGYAIGFVRDALIGSINKPRMRIERVVEIADHLRIKSPKPYQPRLRSGELPRGIAYPPPKRPRGLNYGDA